MANIRELLNLIIRPIQSAKNENLDKIGMSFCNIALIIMSILTTIFWGVIYRDGVMRLEGQIVMFFWQLAFSYISLLFWSFLLWILIRIIPKDRINYKKIIRILFPYFIIHAIMIFTLMNMPRLFGFYYILNFRLYLRIALCLWISVQLYIQMKYHLKYSNGKNLIISIIWGIPFWLVQIFWMPN